MIRMLASSAVCIIVLFIIVVINKEVLANPISDFLAGFIVSSAYWISWITFKERY